jgi:hypothetical protein
LKPKQVEFVHLLIGKHRGNMLQTCNEVGITEQTGRAWRDRAEIQGYANRLMQIEAGKLFVSKHTVIAEVAAIGFGDMAEVMSEIMKATAEAASEAGEGQRVHSDPEEQDGDQEATETIPASLFAADVLNRIPRRVSKTIRKVKFKTATRTIYKRENGRSVIDYREPVLMIDEVEVGDKLKALSFMAEWLGLEPGSLSEDGRAIEAAEEWKGHQIIAPEKAEE